MDWDEVRYFLAVARAGSVRAAADRLAVNHSTVLRRIAELERQLGAQLFEKTPTGYHLTAAGDEVVHFAEQMENASNQLEARVFGRDQAVRGLLRVTTAPILASHLLMPDFVEFARRYPDVELELMSVEETVNLTNREADIAIRVVYDRGTLPRHLHGLKGPEVTSGVYMSRKLLATYKGSVRWIVKRGYGHPAWTHESDIPTSDVPFKTTDHAAQLAAVREGLGMTLLPCFVGDTDPLLTRVPGARTKVNGTLWLLTHGENRRTKRVRLFVDLLAKKLAAHAPLLAGQLPTARDTA